ncbi:hypothetical protein [Filimonas zeae]|nr:hypothetical protein [Filimonas zeae]
MNEDFERFINFIQAVVERPGMFFVNNVEDFSLVILGYRAACSNHSQSYEAVNDFFNNFKGFINKHYGMSEDLDWARLIRFHCVNDFTTLEFLKRKLNEFIAGMV